MNINLLSISHKSAPAEIRGLFAFDAGKKAEILKKLIHNENINGAVVLATCNRTEIYCSMNTENDFSYMEQVIFNAANADNVADIQSYTRRFVNESAVHHIFMVASGLDSAVIGEDQILGQVKEAYYFSFEQNFTDKVLNSMFRLAITGAKSVKTNTMLSKTSVSVPSLALKYAESFHNGLESKKIMIIVASGKTGGILLKNAGGYKRT